MRWSVIKKIEVRVDVIYQIQLMIKEFDYSFGSFLDFKWRGILFSIFFVSFWLLIWYLAASVNQRIKNQRFIVRIILNLCLGYAASFTNNALYRVGDISFFNNSTLWADIPTFNPEFTISLLLIYMLGFSAHEYFQSSMNLKEEQLKSEKLEKENVMVQYKALKAQIEPHFLFNSLSILASIVHSNADLASEFIVKLSKTLRYLIEKNEFTLVTLRKELTMVEDYFFLLKTRFEQGVLLENSIDTAWKEKIVIPPLSIQLLIENAIKHNKFTTDHPLRIQLSLESEYLVVQNNLNKKNSPEKSTTIGLSNLKERYELVSGKTVEITETKTAFIVRLPVLNRNDYANINY